MKSPGIYHLLFKDSNYHFVIESNLGLLTHVQYSQFTDTRSWWRKVQHFIMRPSKEYWRLVLKRPELPDGFQGKVFRDRVRERVAGCATSLWTFFWLVGGEVDGSQHYQPSSSNQSGVYVLVVSMQLTFSTSWGFQYSQNISLRICSGYYP